MPVGDSRQEPSASNRTDGIAKPTTHRPALEREESDQHGRGFEAPTERRVLRHDDDATNRCRSPSFTPRDNARREPSLLVKLAPHLLGRGQVRLDLDDERCAPRGTDGKEIDRATLAVF